jgi:hypothetical protein
MRLTIPLIAGLMIVVGAYFFPLGEDIVFKAILDFAGGDYWQARLYQYCIFGSMMFVGFMLLRYGTGPITKYGLVALAILTLLVAGII